MCSQNFQNHSMIKLRVKVEKIRKNCTQQLYNADLGLSIWPLKLVDKIVDHEQQQSRIQRLRPAVSTHGFNDRQPLVPSLRQRGRPGSQRRLRGHQTATTTMPTGTPLITWRQQQQNTRTWGRTRTQSAPPQRVPFVQHFFKHKHCHLTPCSCNLITD